MKARIVTIAIALVGVVAAAAICAAESGSNGVYGGYVGSDRWFSIMRQSAANQAMLQSLSGGKKQQKLPADYVELAGHIVFPGGNPFPKGRLPDLRISARDKDADPVERAPHLDKNGWFYTALKKGVTYDLSWMYYFGSKEKFATLQVKPEGPRQRQLAIEYRVPQSATQPANASSPKNTVENPAPNKHGGTSPASDGDYTLPESDGGYKSPGSDGSYAHPKSDGGYHPPTSDGGYTPPKSDGGYTPPKSDGGYRSPRSDGGYKSPSVGPGYQPPGSR